MASASIAEAATPQPGQWMRVYCSTHNLGFTAPRNERIQCESGPHELDARFPYSVLWQYCCDCQHYWPGDISKEQSVNKDCPVCEREIARRFFCDTCNVISVESNKPGRRKVFSISTDGTPLPACPGCLSHPNLTALEHDCQDISATFMTTRGECPFCAKTLELPPSFPCTVSEYVEKLRQQTSNLTFNMEENHLSRSAEGEYVLVENAAGLVLPIVIPRAARLSSKQDFYNVYYELFNCDNPTAGEVVILSPAIVEPAKSGWQLREPGFIKINPDPVSEVFSPPAIVCHLCGSPVSSDHAFCKHCGALIQTHGNESIAQTSTPAQTIETDFADRVEQAEAYKNFTADITLPSAAQTAGSSSGTWKTLFGVAALVVVIAATVVLVKLLSGNPVESKLNKAINTGNLFGPSVDNAQDLYDQLKSQGASEQTLARYRERLVPLLTNHPLQMINDLMVPGSEDPVLTDWQNASRSLKWAAELKRGDSMLLSRSLYCEGRAAFLGNQEDRAIEIWTKSAEADKSWPLPLNGIGLIYSGRKNYSTARGFFQEAIRQDPEWAYPYNNMGTALHLDKNDYAAKGYYQKAVELAPQWARPHAWLGDIALKERDFNSAILEYEAVLATNATGTKNMDLEKIRKRLDTARQQVIIDEE